MPNKVPVDLYLREEKLLQCQSTALHIFKTVNYNNHYFHDHSHRPKKIDWTVLGSFPDLGLLFIGSLWQLQLQEKVPQSHQAHFYKYWVHFYKRVTDKFLSSFFLFPTLNI